MITQRLDKTGGTSVENLKVFPRFSEPHPAGLIIIVLDIFFFFFFFFLPQPATHEIIQTPVTGATDPLHRCAYISRDGRVDISIILVPKYERMGEGKGFKAERA